MNNETRIVPTEMPLPSPKIVPVEVPKTEPLKVPIVEPKAAASTKSEKNK